MVTDSRNDWIELNHISHQSVKVAVKEPALMHHVVAKVVEVGQGSAMIQMQWVLAQIRYMQQNKSLH